MSEVMIDNKHTDGHSKLLMASRRESEKNILRCVSVAWLSKVEPNYIKLFNSLNGKERLIDLALYGRFIGAPDKQGLKPYGSGQLVRRAFRRAIPRLYPEAYKCDIKHYCGNIKDCWLCDIFGYSKEEPKGRDCRTSPLKASFSIGQIPIEDGRELYPQIYETNTDTKSLPLQMIPNIYETAIAIDVCNLGVVMGETLVNEDGRKYLRPTVTLNIGAEERRRRTIAILEVIEHLSDLAIQNRCLMPRSPNVVIGCTHPNYRHNAKLLDMDNYGNIDLSEADSRLKRLNSEGGKCFLGFTPGLISNEDDFLKLAREIGIEPVSPSQAMKDLIEAVKNAEIK